ncbi:hypothetical protein OH77DRAFT_1435142 [Trametes cingulata]|nr:hypothetical protein OH77DRAFT_1435142 [Trametes cingulata]
MHTPTNMRKQRMAPDGALTPLSASLVDAPHEFYWRLATSERVAADVAHSFPPLKFVWKRISKAKIRQILSEGKTSLHEASTELLDERCKAALSGSDLYEKLVHALQSLRKEGDNLDQRLQELKLYQLVARVGTHELVVEWKERADRHKHTVWSESDRAKINAFLAPTAVNPATGLHGQDVATAAQQPLTSPSQRTLVDPGHALPRVEESDDESVEELEASVLDEALDSSSVFRNHWENHA